MIYPNFFQTLRTAVFSLCQNSDSLLSNRMEIALSFRLLQEFLLRRELNRER